MVSVGSGCIKGESANQVHSQTMIALDDCSKKAKRKRKGDQGEEVDFQNHYHEWQLCDLHKDEPRPIIYKPDCLMRSKPNGTSVTCRIDAITNEG